jgi:hypothetical protein
MQAIPVTLPPRPGDSGDQPVDPIASDNDDRDAIGRAPGGFDRLWPTGCDDVDPVCDQVASHFGNLFRFSWDAIIDMNVLSLDIAKRLQSFQQSVL